MTTRENLVHIEQWETIAVTPLPAGWRIVTHDLAGGIVEEACPLTLLQQHLATDVYWDDPTQGDVQYRRQMRRTTHEPPYDKRVVPAGWLSDYMTFEPIGDELCGSGQFLGLLPPGAGVPQWMVDAAAAKAEASSGGSGWVRAPIGAEELTR
jgi:hypothetical protein